MNRIPGLHPREVGECSRSYPAVMVARPHPLGHGRPCAATRHHPLTQARMARRMTAAELSRRLGLNDGAVTGWLQDNHVPARHVPAVADLLSVSPEDVRSWFAAA